MEYRVLEYKTGREMFRGSAQQCADFLKLKNANSFRTYTYKCELGQTTGKRVGYTTEKIIENDPTDYEALHKANLSVLERFYDEYWRSPRKSEFVACGGNMDVVKHKKIKYKEYLQDCGYEAPSKWETYEALNEKEEVVYVGTSMDMEDEFNVDNKQVCAYRSVDCSVRVRGRLIHFRKKPFTGLRGTESETKTSV